MKPLRVILMGSYPAYLLADSMGLNRSVIKRVTTWNEVLVQALSEVDGLSVHVITLSALADDVRTIHDRNLTVSFLPLPNSMNLASLYRGTRKQAINIIEASDPDIVHGIGTEHIWPYVAISSGRPSVITVHGMMTEITRNAPQPILSKRGIKQRVFSMMERHVLGRTRHLIAINPYITRVTAGLTSARTRLIENPVHNRFFDVQAHPETGDYFLFVGGIEKLKGANYIIDALGILSDKTTINTPVRLMAAGPDSSTSFRQELDTKIESLDLGNQVRFLGFTPPHALANVYAGAAGLVLPSLQETSPMCIAEAMSAGLPVIATTVGGIPEMIDDGRTGLLVPPKDPERLADAMMSLWNSPEQRKAMGLAGHRRAVERWKPETIAQQTVTAYREIAGQGRP